MADFTIGVVGNPNSGKTTLFNRLTGARQHVGNWPGVTVERKVGEYRHGDHTFELVDLPGIYAMSAQSLDEQVARDYILGGEADLIVSIADATHLERDLYLTVQLLEMRIPLVLALNMMDVVHSREIRIDVDELRGELGCPVISISARNGEGVDDLLACIADQARTPRPPTASITYGRDVERALETLVPVVSDVAQSRDLNPRWLAVKLIEDDGEAAEIVANVPGAAETADRARRTIEQDLGDDGELAVADGRYGFIHGVTQATVSRPREVRRSITDAIDKLVLNRALSIPLFLGVMYLTFLVTINFGGCFIDFFDGVAGAIFVDGPRAVLDSVGSPAWLTVLLADGVGGGLRLIAALLPPIGLMFVCLAVLEDSGYMARAAFVMDRLMRAIGLPGKAFVPMLIGIGCTVPAIMATRTLRRPRDRYLTIAMNPLMSCGARLPVYVFFGAAFFPDSRGLIVFSLYLVGIALAIGTGLLLKKTLLRAEVPHFVMELPPYHVPTVRAVALHTWLRLRGFAVRAGGVIVIVAVVMSLLNSIGTDGSFGHENSGRSILAAIGRGVVPVFRPMGIRNENWPAAVGLFTGLFAKEAVVGTLNSLYTGRKDENERPFRFWSAIVEAAATVPRQLADTFGVGLGGTLADPTGATAPEEPEAATGTYRSMRKQFDGTAGAYAYLLFVLVYAPCVAAIAAVYRETSLGWTAFIVGYLTALAWGTAVTYYQLAGVTEHPWQTVAWLGGLLAGLAALAAVLRALSGRVLQGVLEPNHREAR
jgi:ferrous iron transport protein B